MQNPLGALEIVRVNAKHMDPALDLDAMDLDAYRKTRDPELIKCREGQTPARFRIKPLKAAYVVDALESQLQKTRYTMAVLASCHEITLHNGEVIKPARMERAIFETQIADASWLDVIRNKFGLETVYEIGRVAFERATLPEDARGPFSWPAG